MCIALQSTRPSWTPLLRTVSSTCGVMFRKAIRSGRLNARYSVYDFMAGDLLGARKFVNSGGRLAGASGWYHRTKRDEEVLGDSRETSRRLKASSSAKPAP